MKNITMIIVLAISMFVMNGCAGKSFTWDDAETVKVGDTAEVVVKKMKGKPYMIKAAEVDGKASEVWVWAFASGLTGTAKSVSFVLTDGIVTKVPTITENIKEL